MATRGTLGPIPRDTYDGAILARKELVPPYSREQALHLAEVDQKLTRTTVYVSPTQRAGYEWDFRWNGGQGGAAAAAAAAAAAPDKLRLQCEDGQALAQAEMLAAVSLRDIMRQEFEAVTAFLAPKMGTLLDNFLASMAQRQRDLEKWFEEVIQSAKVKHSQLRAVLTHIDKHGDSLEHTMRVRRQVRDLALTPALQFNFPLAYLDAQMALVRLPLVPLTARGSAAVSAPVLACNATVDYIGSRDSPHRVFLHYDLKWPQPDFHRAMAPLWRLKLTRWNAAEGRLDSTVGPPVIENKGGGVVIVVEKPLPVPGITASSEVLPAIATLSLGEPGRAGTVRLVLQAWRGGRILPGAAGGTLPVGALRAGGVSCPGDLAGSDLATVVWLAPRLCALFVPTRWWQWAAVRPCSGSRSLLGSSLVIDRATGAWHLEEDPDTLCPAAATGGVRRSRRRRSKSRRSKRRRSSTRSRSRSRFRPRATSARHN